MLASSPGCALPVPSSMRRCARPLRLGSRAPGRSSGRSTRGLSTAVRAATSTIARTAAAASAPRRSRARLARAHRVDEDEERRRPRRAPRHPERDERGTAEPWPASPGARHRSSSDQYASSAAKSRPAAITGTETSSGASSIASSAAYGSADEHDGHGDERRPAEHDRGDERDERDDRDAGSRLLEGAVSARERHRCDREEAGDAADRRSLYACQPCVAPECPHLLERRLQISVAPGGEADATALEARAQDLTLEQPQAIRVALDRRFAPTRPAGRGRPR